MHSDVKGSHAITPHRVTIALTAPQDHTYTLTFGSYDGPRVVLPLLETLGFAHAGANPPHSR